MPRKTAPLTEVQIKGAKPQEKDYKLFDGGGLHLLVTSTGGKLWRLKYRFGGMERLLTLGGYPQTSLAEARKRRLDAKQMIDNGIDPGAVKKAQKFSRAGADANSFEVVGREWFDKFSPGWTESNAEKVKARLEKDLYPWLGNRPVDEIEPPELLATIRRVEARGALDTAHRVKHVCGQIFRYAIATGRAKRDIAADLKGALPQPRRKHFASVTDPKEIAPLLRIFDDYRGSFPVRCALLLAPMLFVRPGELRQMEWTELDLDAAQWNVPGPKMKMKEPHLVPLPLQVVKILKELQPLTGGGRYVFPSIRTNTRPMSENTVNAAMRRLGIDKETLTGHGFRAMARTILDEILGFRPDIIEHQLAHAVSDPNGRAYNRTAHLTERRKMMQVWADYLDGLKLGAKVIPLRRAS